MKLLFCSSAIVPVICPFKTSTPKVCCNSCMLKWECHKKQKSMAEASGDYTNIMPCVRLSKEDDDIDYENECDYLT